MTDTNAITKRLENEVSLLERHVKMLKTIKEKVEALEIETAEDYKGEKTIVSPKINIALARYYKGTALVGVTKRLEEYLDMANPTESNINYL